MEWNRRLDNNDRSIRGVSRQRGMRLFTDFERILGLYG
jgi:hypothetical protein